MFNIINKQRNAHRNNEVPFFSYSEIKKYESLRIEEEWGNECPRTLPAEVVNLFDISRKQYVSVAFQIVTSF